MKKINQTEERYASVLSDAGFKAVLGDPDNKDLLISIINIILDGERVVHDLEYRTMSSSERMSRERKAYALTSFAGMRWGLALSWRCKRHDTTTISSRGQCTTELEPSLCK